MSMNTYPLHELAALVITPELAAIINGSLWSQETDTRPNPEGLSQKEFVEQFGDVSEANDMLSIEFNIDTCSCSEFEGTMTPLKADGTLDDDKAQSFDDDFIAYIPCSRGISLFRAAYGSYKELVEEFRETLSPLADALVNFPLETCICDINGTYFC